MAFNDKAMIASKRHSLDVHKYGYLGQSQPSAAGGDDFLLRPSDFIYLQLVDMKTTVGLIR